MARRIFRTPIRGRARVLLLCVAVVAEAAFAAYLWESGKERPTHGYLMKVGPRFVVAWTRGDRHFDTTVYGSLEDAVRFAGEELGLTIGKHLWASPELEYLSLKDRFGTYVLHWKTFDSSFLNQLTFHNHDEAVRFAQAIRQGAYSRSPFGHSVVLAPRDR